MATEFTEITGCDHDLLPVADHLLADVHAMAAELAYLRSQFDEYQPLLTRFAGMSPAALLTARRNARKANQ